MTHMKASAYLMQVSLLAPRGQNNTDVMQMCSGGPALLLPQLMQKCLRLLDVLLWTG